MRNILIIKTGAAGDVVRTTSLLNVLDGNIYWVIDPNNTPLLPEHKSLFPFALSEAFELTRKTTFELVISLEEDLDCITLATSANSKELTGLYLHNGVVSYTDNSAHWFEMSRVSKLGLTKANQLKLDNTTSYQEHIFRMIGKGFSGEPYRIFTALPASSAPGIIGIEPRAGKQWPNKQWWGYAALSQQLTEEGILVRQFTQRMDIRDYLSDIAGCSHVISGDTLAMHVALAYGKSCTAIFNCTSPQEIYDYGLLKKLVSPLLAQYFYVSTLDKNVIESVSLEDVYKTLPVIA